MVNTQPSGLSKRVLKRITALGFTPPYIVDLAAFGHKASKDLGHYIAQGHHATMEWMKETQARRGHPQTLWPDAKSAIVMGINYGPSSDPMASLTQTERATISVYARNHDYHALMKGRLKEIAGLIASDTGNAVKVFVDTAPLMEKPLAAAAGLGWQGKHTNLVSRDYGSWLFLGTILSAVELLPTLPETDHCGQCRACLDICPTQAFPHAYQIDARRCISYLTIEHKGSISIELREKMGNRIYGCDDCLAICPWNKFAQQSSEIKLQARDDLNAPKLAELAALTEAEFRQHFAKSPIKRIGAARFLRNVLYAIGNSTQLDLAGSARAHLAHSDPIVRDAAQWAINQLERNP